MKTSKPEVHVLDLPETGRVTFTIQEYPQALIAVLSIPTMLKTRKERRFLERWQRRIVKPLDADSRPMILETYLDGVPVSFGMAGDSQATLFVRK